MMPTINPNPFHIKLQSNQNKLVIGDTSNMSSVNSAFVSGGSITPLLISSYDPSKFSSVMAPTSNNKSVFDLTGQDTATKINIRPAFQLAKPGNYTTTVLADHNDCLEFTRTPGDETKTNITIPKIELLETGQVAVSFRVTREDSPNNSNTVRVIATKADMEKLLSNAEGLTPEALKKAQDGLKASVHQVQSGSNETPVKKTGEERGKVSPEVAESALNSRAIMYGEKHEDNKNFIKYKAELERGGYTVTKGTDGKYKVTKKSRRNFKIER